MKHQCSQIFHWSWNFWERFSLISFLRNFSRIKRWWREELQLPVTTKRSFLSSYKWKKMFERNKQLRLLPKQALCQNYFMFEIIFAKWIWFANSFKCFSDRNIWPPGQRAKMRERIASESFTENPYKIIWGYRTCVGRVKTEVTNHLRRIFRIRVHKAAERNTAGMMNSDKLTETNS